MVTVTSSPIVVAVTPEPTKSIEPAEVVRDIPSSYIVLRVPDPPVPPPPVIGTYAPDQQSISATTPADVLCK
jgi:hypothetical protein